MKKANEPFPALTGIRAVAAFMVFFHHLPLWLKPGFLIGLQLSFYTGVTVFFVLSGFLITYRYYGKIQWKGSSIRHYFQNRFARIYPLYFLVLTVVLLSGNDFSAAFALQNYTLSSNLSFLFPSHGTAIPPSWSLTVEACFYLAAPLFFFLCRNYSAASVITVLSLTLLMLMSGAHSSKEQVAIMFSSLFGNGPAFFCGMCLGLFLLRKPVPVTPLRKGLRTWVAVLLLLLLFLPLIYATNKGNGIRFPLMFIGNNLLMPLSVALLFYGLIVESSLISRVLSTRLWTILGRSSYAFYLIHQPLIEFGDRHIRSAMASHHNGYVLVVFGISLVLSVVLYSLIEEPLNKLLRSRWSGVAPRPDMRWGILLSGKHGPR